MTHPSPILIRPGQPEDADAVARLAAESAAFLRALGDPCDFRFDAAAYLDNAFGPQRVFDSLLAHRDREVVGFLFWHLGYDSDAAVRLIHVIDLFVTADFRGQGVGRALLAAAATQGRRLGAVEMRLEVYRPNHAARDFYDRLGAIAACDLDRLTIPISNLTDRPSE